MSAIFGVINWNDQPVSTNDLKRMRRLVEHPDQGRELARRAKILADEQYSFPVFERTVRELYAWIEHATT